MHILNLLDDDFTDARYLVLTPEGFVYLGMMDSAITVQYDDKGQLKQPYGVSCALEEGVRYHLDARMPAVNFACPRHVHSFTGRQALGVSSLSKP